MTTQINVAVQPVILCGGSGDRLWPLSRSGFPKQFLCLAGDESLFQQSVARLSSIKLNGYTVAAPTIVCNEEHRHLAHEQLREIGQTNATYLLEPHARNTAPALTLAALHAVESGNDPILVVTPSDQTLADTPAFLDAIAAAIAASRADNIVLLGITPDRAETGYGYIQAASADNKVAAVSVKRFFEKPDAVTAAAYLAEGDYFWNAGMFVLKASVWLAALKNFRSDIASACEAAWREKKLNGQFVQPDKVLFQQVPKESVDYAVMEKCPGSAHQIKMVPLDAGWSDLGAWDAVWRVADKDANGNVHNGDVISHESHHNYVHGSNRLVTLVGVDNLVVVDTSDALLVADKSRSQDVKHIVNQLIAQHRTERTLHRKVNRPWGWYDSIDEGANFKVKRIHVNAGASLSLQMHYKRAEHWIVVCGTAEVTIGKQKLTLTENQSCYIPLGETHRLENRGTTPLEIIEVQSGSYLGEDDIVRFEDVYGRS